MKTLKKLLILPAFLLLMGVMAPVGHAVDGHDPVEVPDIPLPPDFPPPMGIRPIHESTDDIIEFNGSMD